MDLPESEVQFSDEPQGGTFSNILPTPFLQFYRGWASVDVTVGDKPFRFITTHLEPESNTIRDAQANELLSGPANTDLPVIMAGDFNSPAGGTGTGAYSTLLGAGFVDAWSATQPKKELGLTYCHAADLLDATPLRQRSDAQRIDLVLFHGKLSAFDAKVTGDKLSERTPSGLWPSDHAGVVENLRAK